jgi:hypothetical protein
VYYRQLRLTVFSYIADAGEVGDDDGIDCLDGSAAGDDLAHIIGCGGGGHIGHVDHVARVGYFGNIGYGGNVDHVDEVGRFDKVVKVGARKAGGGCTSGDVFTADAFTASETCSTSAVGRPSWVQSSAMDSMNRHKMAF